MRIHPCREMLILAAIISWVFGISKLPTVPTRKRCGGKHEGPLVVTVVIPLPDKPAISTDGPKQIQGGGSLGASRSQS